MTKRAICLIALSAFFFAGVGRAGNATGLPGSTTKTEAAAQQCDFVFVGRVTKDGWEEGSTMGSFGISDLGVEALQIFRGTPSPQIKVSYGVLIGQEEIPKVGRSYIFFVKKLSGFPDLYLVVKLLPYLRDNIVSVKRLISN